ncbi:2-hydroxyacyl-CoA dehydratase [bacterium]|nr:2-hydroxyacyl-CoA dehydratase [bacterium]
MATKYDAMWESLGLDLEAHDALLSALGQAYRSIILAQRDRPKAMDYFNFVMSEVHGLRIQELLEGKKQGHKVVGSFCVFVPEEIVRAADATLVGLCTGADFAMEKVERLLPRNTCALIKSAFGFKLGKVCPFLEAADIVVGENTCDGKKKSYEVLDRLVPNLYVMDLPQTKSDEGRALLRAEFVRFKQAIEKLTGNTIDAAGLRRAIQLVNAKRSAMHRLAALRSAEPAPVSGLDALLMNQVYFYDEPTRFIDAVHKVCDEVEWRVADGLGVAPAGAPRLLIAGCPMAVPNWKLPWLIETSGAIVVGEESCTGERGTRHLVCDPGADADLDGLLDAIVDRYFQIDCAIFTPNTDRLRHIQEMAATYHADGVVLYGLQFCQPYLIESLPFERALEEQGIPALRLETDYSPEDVEPVRTRIEAFLERLA